MTAISDQKWEAKLLELTRGILQHGNGQLTFSSTEIKGGERKIIIEAGRRYVFFVQPDLTENLE